MAQSRGSPWAQRRRPLLEMFFLERLSPVVLAALLVAIAGASIAFGRVALVVHIHFATEREAGEQLNPMASFLGTGSSLLTALPAWLATAFFVFALLRLQSGPLEPPPAAIPSERLTVSQLRAALRAEFRLVRIAMASLSLIAVADAARAANYGVAALRGNLVAQSTLTLTLVEAAGLLAAATALGIWVWRFAAELERLGAL